MKQFYLKDSENYCDKTDLGKLYKLGHLFFGGRPSDDKVFDQCKELGIETVIDLKTIDENLFDEKEAAEKKGLNYIHFPIEKCHSFSKEGMNRINSFLEENGEKPVMIYCMSANRASTWLIMQLVQQHNYNIDNAVEKAKTVGLDKEMAEENARNYLKELGYE